MTPIEKIRERELNGMNSNPNKQININNNESKEDLTLSNKNKISEKNENPKGIHLNQEEKDSFFGVLGFIEKNIYPNRDYKIISVEKFYGIINFIKKLSKIMNTKLREMMKT